VVGKGSVTVLDPARMTTNAYEAKRSSPLLTSGVVLHVLPEGSVFDLDARALVPQQPAVDPEDAAELAEAQHDLRQLARDIAASDVSPTTLRRRQARTRRQTTPDPQDGARQ
jgi:cyanophycinase